MVGRQAECQLLDQLVAAVQAGDSRVVVLHGEPGVGKTALLEYVAERAAGCRVTHAAGVQTEMELAFATLHQLCAPLLDGLNDLPGPQRDALATAFGMSAGPPPDRFLVGLAVLGLLSDAASERPLLCLIDDQQWADYASAQVLGFVARRLGAESLGLVFAARVPDRELSGLPELAVAGLPEAEARALLDAALTAPISVLFRDQIVAETRGNPLALLELPRALTAAELAGGFGLAGPVLLSGSLEDSFRLRVEALPDQTRRLLLLAAADPSGDAALVWRAAGRLGITAEAAGPAADAGLAEFGVWLRFRHPLVRSAVYRPAQDGERRLVHGALADSIDPELDPDRRAWHRAMAAPGPDEEVAAELERSAGRARARGGLAAAAAFLERAVMLTLDDARRAGRALAAARIKAQAGQYGAALDLLAVTEAGPASAFQRAHAGLLRAQIAFYTNRGSDAPPLLLNAARQLEPIDPGLSRATYLDSLAAAQFAGRLASAGAGLQEVARAAAAAPQPLHAPRPPDLLLAGLAAHYNDGYPAGLPILRQALIAFGDDMPRDEELRWLWLACVAALHIWDDDRWEQLSERFLELAREAGSLSSLPLALPARAFILSHAGELASAAVLAGEQRAVGEATGTSRPPYSALFLAALRGDAGAVSAMNEAIMRDAASRGEGMGITVTGWADALVSNGLGHYQQAMGAARQAIGGGGDLVSPGWALAELVEAATRSGDSDTAADALARLAGMTSASGTEWALGIEARCRALLAEGEPADHLYRESIGRLSRTRLRPDLARAHLLYGEWLRRERRRSEARAQLRAAHGMLEAMGMEAFADRAAHELKATGETARRRPAVPGTEELTAQEAQIARLARDGLTNSQIGARLFLSPRTVQYHLGNVFAKLSITSRSQLDRALPGNTAAF
jgi:DNA-binding CsgD family transcriptional regulator/tetratricopeptide (TPR) repeat protein